MRKSKTWEGTFFIQLFDIFLYDWKAVENAIFYFNFEHFLFLYIKLKKLGDFRKNRGFSKFNENGICRRQILEILNLSCGHVRSHTKFGPDRFSRFDVY